MQGNYSIFFHFLFVGSSCLNFGLDFVFTLRIIIVSKTLTHVCACRQFLSTGTQCKTVIVSQTGALTETESTCVFRDRLTAVELHADALTGLL